MPLPLKFIFYSPTSSLKKSQVNFSLNPCFQSFSTWPFLLWRIMKSFSSEHSTLQYYEPYFLQNVLRLNRVSIEAAVILSLLFESRILHISYVSYHGILWYIHSGLNGNFCCLLHLEVEKFQLWLVILHLGSVSRFIMEGNQLFVTYES